MKKRKVVIVTLLCGLVMGNYVETNSFRANTVFAQNMEENSSTNRIVFHRYNTDFSPYVDEVQIEGKINETIQLDSISKIEGFVENYELVDRQGKEIKQITINKKMHFEHEIYLKPKTFQYEIEFIEESSGQIIKGKIPQFVTGEVDSIVTLQRDILPDGYEFVTDDTGMNLSSKDVTLPRKPSKLVINIQKRLPRNFITFVDDHGKVVGSKIVFGEIGSKVELEDSDRFKIKGNKIVTIQQDRTKVSIPVTNTKVWKIIRYVTKDGTIVEGGGGANNLVVGSYTMVSLDYAPDNYTLVNENEKYFVFDNNNLYIDVLVKGDTVNNTINIVDETGKVLEEIKSKGEFGETIIISEDRIPGYKITGEPLKYKENGSIQKIVAKKVIENTISFIDGNSNVIGNPLTVKGIDGQKISVQPPNGYYFPGNVNDYIYISSVKSRQIMLVSKSNNNNTGSNSNSGSTSSNTGSSTPTPGTGNNNNVTPPTAGDTNESEFKSVVSTHSHMAQIPLFDSNGKQSNRSLSSTTDWQVDRKKTIKGETYYRVSSNEWVKAEHVFEYSSIDEVITTQDKVTPLYDSRGKQSVSRSLAGNTSWQTDKSTVINGQKYYRVSTIEWLSAADIK